MLYLLKQLLFSKKSFYICFFHVNLLQEFYHPAKFELTRMKNAKVCPSIALVEAFSILWAQRGCCSK